MLWMPSWGGMINGLMTLQGAWDKLRTDPVLRMMVLSLAFYGMSTFEGPMMSIKSVNSLSHYTDWTIGHVHSGALGWNGMIVFGSLYYLVPKLWGREQLYSLRLVNWHIWLATLGIVVYAAVRNRFCHSSSVCDAYPWRWIVPRWCAGHGLQRLAHNSRRRSQGSANGWSSNATSSSG